jgi:uncharacterized membrane protein YoaK (UPF0700 family)
MMVAVTVAFAVRALRLRPVRIERSLLGLQSLLLVAAAILASATRPSGHPTGSAACVVAMIAVVAMASQNVMLHLTRDRAPTTAVMTGNLVVATLALVVLLTTPAPDRAVARAQWTHSWPILAGFIVGCLAGAASIRIWSDNGWFAPAIASVTLATWWRFHPPASEAALASISGRP